MNMQGTYIAITTPFTPQEELDFPHLQSNLDRWLAEPIDGLVVSGTTGEAAYLTLSERIQLWEFCAPQLKAAGRRMIAGAAAESTRATLEMVLQAAKSGAEAVLVLTPTYFKPGADALFRHYTSLADSSPIPVLLYNYPAFTGVEIPSSTIIKLAEHPNIIGMKDSSASLPKLTAVLAHRPDFQIFSGLASGLFSFLSLGGAGGIFALGNILPGQIAQIFKKFHSGETQEASRQQLKLAALSEALEIRYGIPAIKYAMDQSGYFGASPRQPLAELPLAARAEVDALLQHYFQAS